MQSVCGVYAAADKISTDKEYHIGMIGKVSQRQPSLL